MGVSIIFRAVLLFYGRWQDANSPVKYTDIDYLVFTDASRSLASGGSPYDRATYRYTPLLAWLLYPTTWGGIWFEFGKVLFAAGDLLARCTGSHKPSMVTLHHAGPLRNADSAVLNVLNETCRLRLLFFPVLSSRFSSIFSVEFSSEVF